MPEDHYVDPNERFKALYNGRSVVVTAVLVRTAVIILNGEKTLIRKDCLFVPDSFRLAQVDQQKLAMRKRAANGWRSNWRRKIPY